MTELEEYQLYNRCRKCGQILNDYEIEDNNGLCDFCYNDVNTWKEFPVGCNLNREIKE